MPYVSIETNVPEASVPADFLKIMTSSAAATIGKDESLFLISVRAGANLIFGGSAEPAAFVKVVSIGKLGEEENKRHSKVFSQLLEDHLKVSPKRMYIQFMEAAAQDIGHNYTTFA